MIICPFNRPTQLVRVLRMWETQTVRTPLVLCARDPGEWVQVARTAGAIVTIGHVTIGEARNEGVRLARVAGAPWVWMWDDDNYYGPRYCEAMRLSAAAAPAILTQGIAFVRLPRAADPDAAIGDLHLFEGETRFAPGHCTAFDPREALRFPEVSLSEDVAWTQSMLEAGASLHRAAPWHSVYNRTGGGHAFEAGAAEFRRCFGASINLGQLPDSFVDAPCSLAEFPAPEAVDDDAVFTDLESRDSPRAGGPE